MRGMLGRGRGVGRIGRVRFRSAAVVDGGGRRRSVGWSARVATRGEAAGGRYRMSAASFLWVALGGALGSVMRYWLAAMIAGMTGPYFPWGTMLINVLGSFVIGWFGTWTGA